MLHSVSKNGYKMLLLLSHAFHLLMGSFQSIFANSGKSLLLYFLPSHNKKSLTIGSTSLFATFLLCVTFGKLPFSVTKILNYSNVTGNQCIEPVGTVSKSNNASIIKSYINVHIVIKKAKCTLTKQNYGVKNVTHLGK